MDAVGNDHRHVGDRGLERRRPGLADARVRSGEDERRITPVHFDCAGLGIVGARGARHHDLDVATRRGDFGRRFAKHRPVPLHFLCPAAGEQAERATRGIELEHPPRVDPRRRRRPILERMAHERRAHAALAEEFLLKRENHRELIDRREATDALRSPRPHLRRDVVQHRNTGGMGGRGGTEVISRVVDKNHEIVLFALK